MFKPWTPCWIDPCRLGGPDQNRQTPEFELRYQDALPIEIYRLSSQIAVVIANRRLSLRGAELLSSRGSPTGDRGDLDSLPTNHLKFHGNCQVSRRGEASCHCERSGKASSRAIAHFGDVSREAPFPTRPAGAEFFSRRDDHALRSNLDSLPLSVKVTRDASLQDATRSSLSLRSKQLVAMTIYNMTTSS